MLDELFASRDLAEWVVMLKALTTPWTVVQTAAEAAVDPQVVANGLVATVGGSYPLVRSPAQFDELRPELPRAPQYGEHTEEVLLELGRSWDDIAVLKTAEAIS